MKNGRVAHAEVKTLILNRNRVTEVISYKEVS